MGNKKQFKAESKRLLDLMIHSIYTHKEIFLRELISNSSDAIDKLYFTSLTDSSIKLNKDSLEINIELDKDNRTITIKDNGIGMTKDQLEENLGTIAKSGSDQFKKEMEESHDAVDIIGQFGVGFYSAFMVGHTIEVTSKHFSSEESFTWKSSGDDGYTINKGDRDETGTTITIHLRENDDTNYDEYLESYKIKSLIKKYSDFVRYPIKMDVENTTYDDDKNPVTTIENQTLNSMIPIWKKQKSEVSKEEYNEFFMSEFNEYSEPAKVIHSNVDGQISYNSLMFIPGNVPYDFYHANSKSSFKLYSKGIFIMDEYDKLIPEHFKFIKGLVDTQDISLNISRELLQSNRQLTVIKKHLEKKIKSELETMLKSEREEYEKFFDNFGLQLKFGTYNDFGTHKDLLKDLLLFKTSYEDKYSTLQEYVDRMKDEQTDIYFASGKTIEQINSIPQLEKVKEKGYEVLYLLDDIDEFLMQILQEYDGKTLKSINQGNLELDSEEEIKELEKKQEESKDLLEKIKDSLDGKVSDVKLSSRLKTHPVCLVSGDGLSFEMEKVLSQMPNSENVHASRILEINPEHELFKKLQTLNDEKLNKYSKILYSQALLIEGLKLENPAEFSLLLSELMTE